MLTREEIRRSETMNDDNAVCPWCGYEHSDCWEWSDSEEEWECHKCGKLFEYETEVSRTFVCRKVAKK